MKTVNFNVPFVDLAGNVIIEKGTQVLIKTIVANKIGSAPHGSDFVETLHRFELAKQILRSEESIEISPDDCEFIKNNLPGLTISAVVQIIDLFN